MEEAASTDYARKIKLERQALALYEEALQQDHPGKVEGNARLRIEFQKARILTELGEVDRAAPVWKKLAEQREVKDIAREAALKLAEVVDVQHAGRWFQAALDLCSGGDLCSYVHFKRAWLIKQSSKNALATDEAIAEIELALFDSKGQIREESLRDYLVFLGERGASGKDLATTIDKVDSLGKKLNRSHLIGDLAESYFAAGNKASGTVVLAQAQRFQPSFVRLCRLTEEQYGARDWDAFRLSLDDLSGQRASGLQKVASDADRVEAEKLLRRLVIQLDGERISQSDRKADFQKAALAYIALYPKSPEKAKFQEGFLASESDPQAKLEKLARWIEEEPNSIKLREFRASIAQKAGLNDLVSAEMGALAGLTGSREHKYLQARALYEGKKYDQALPVFRALAQVSSGSPDQWAIQSQNLALDILAMNKSSAGFSAVIAQASSWLDAGWATIGGNKLNPKLSGELSEMAKIRDQARFEMAVALGETPMALGQFMDFCRNKMFADKSCENARVLSLKLKDQQALLEVLGLMGPSQQGALAAELEGAGEFARAAELLSKQASDLNSLFKVALLRELSGDEALWKASVSKIVATQANAKSRLSDAQERLWVAMARDAGVLDVSSLRVIQSVPARGQVAEAVEAMGKGNADTHKVLVSAPVMTGPAWKKMTLAQLEMSIAQQQKIGFYGRNSRALFEKRLKAVTELAKAADGFASKADASTQTIIVAKMQSVYEGLAKEIRESPIPAGIPESAIPELKAGLEEMAKPFDEKAKAYAAAVQPIVDTVVTQSAHAGEEWAPRLVAAQIQLKKNPESSEALSTLRDGYRALKKERLASYFEGRLQAGRNP